MTIFRFGLGKAIIGPDTIETWARKIIDTDATRTDYVLGLTDAGTLGNNETLSILFKNSDKIDSELWPIVFGLTSIRLKSDQINLKQACYTVEQASIEVFRETGEFIGGMGLDDSYYLADSKIYGTLKLVREEFDYLTGEYEDLGRDFLSAIK
ncbi:MAG: hypothetical protein EOO50_04345 [Flavobacterium sp.]|uniref:hypothetical protein n=1 Tax=Flavobacterium sp. TaxID=239 RepID=UPI00120A9203|nr:hypothetical protein [Flavobacterium sp.]RZJ67812.1 MAG: hypothetical protein EOO50_04345 [Flavobacterium sp.]